MTKAIELNGFSYFPALRTRQAELNGYAELPAEDKERLRPFFTIGKWPNSDDINRSVERACRATDERPFILNITESNTHHTAESVEFLDPEGNFSRWRAFLASHEDKQFVPVALVTESATPRQVAQQARHLEAVHGKVAFHIRRPTLELPKVQAALSALDTPDSAIFFIDAGYARGNTTALAQTMIRSINQIRSNDPNALIVCMATSFPRSVVEFGEQRGVIPMEERSLYELAGGRGVAVYGDHGSIHAVAYPSTGGTMIPRVDYPVARNWYFERRPGEGRPGYQAAAQAILDMEDVWDDRLNVWGAEMIRQAARGNLERMGSAAKWIAVRVNLHIHTQLHLSALEELEPDDESILDDWDEDMDPFE